LASVAILITAIACRRASSSAASREPAGGDGTDRLARLDRSHPGAGVIAVLGSSTAAGVGASAPELTWVSRYRAYLSREFPEVVVINLSVGGFTTFHIQPSTYVPPSDRPRPDPAKNIDAALTYQPNAVVINLPSNDQAAGYGWDEQLGNYERVVAAAAAAQVPLWITTSQPRNFARLEQRQELGRARAEITRRFATHALDFWTPLATPDGLLKRELDSGDGTHLNDKGHALLAEVVIAARLPQAVLPRLGH
jgi:lysophospholipase L1-like esterase